MAGHGGGTTGAGGTRGASLAAPATAPGLGWVWHLELPARVLWECWVLKTLCWPEPGAGDRGHHGKVSLQ